MLQEKNFGKLVSDVNDFDLPQDDYLDSFDLIPVKDGSAPTLRRQSIKGNKLIASELYAAGGKAIGYKYDEKNNRGIYFVANSDGSTAILIYDPETDTISKRITSDLFNVDNSFQMHSIQVVDNRIVWVDKDNKIRGFDFDWDDATTFNNATAPVLLKRYQPWQAPWTSRYTNNALNFNNVTDHSYQFAYRYIYLDNSISVISPRSQVSIGDKVPVNYNDTTNNTVRVYIPGRDLYKLREIEVFYREDGSDDWYSFDFIPADQVKTTQTNPNTGNSENVFYVDFTGPGASTIVPSAEINKKDEAIPKESASIVYAKNRLFGVRTRMNTELGSIDGIGLTAQAFDDTADTAPRKMYFAPASVYDVGLEFFNEDIESTPVVKKARLEIPDVSWGSGALSNKYMAKVTLTGNPPDNFDHYRILLTKNQRYIQWGMVTVNLMLWSRKYVEGETTVEGYEYLDGDDIYFRAGSIDNTRSVRQVHVQLPLNMPFEPSPEQFFVRIINSTWPGYSPSDFDTELVYEIKGDKLVIGNFGYFDWSAIATAVGIDGTGRASINADVMIFDINDAKENIFYETGREFNIVEVGGVRQFETTEIYLEGDSFLWNGPASWIYRQHYSYSGGSQIGSSGIRGLNQAFTSTKKRGLSEAQGLYDVPGEDVFYVPDYDRKAWDFGRVNVKKEHNVTKEGFSIGYSNISTPSLEINGLHNWDAANNYALDNESGDIQKLVLVHENLMIAIHSRSVTTLYLGESFLKTATGEDIPTKSEGVIGQHRPQQGEYGTINPESVVFADGIVLWWDALRGCMVVYDNNGLDDISEKSWMKSHFEDLAATIKPYRDQAQVIGVYHEFYDMAIWTFKPIVVDGETVFAGQTIGFNINKREFVTKFHFIPEAYGNIPQGIISFKDSKLYRHDKNTKYSNFYGVQYTPYIDMLINQAPNQEKIFNNFAVNANQKLRIELTVDDQYTVIEDNDYHKDHHSLYADVLRDQNSRGGKLRGNTMLGRIGRVRLTVPDSRADQYLELNQISSGFDLVPGHYIEAKK